MKRSIPIWITVLASLMTLSGLAFSVTLYFSPQIFFPATNFLAKDIHHFTDMWAMQQFTMSVLLVYALVGQQRPVLLLGLQIMIFMNTLMAISNFATDEKKLIGENLLNAVLCILMAFAMRHRKSKTLVPNS